MILCLHRLQLGGEMLRKEGGTKVARPRNPPGHVPPTQTISFRVPTALYEDAGRIAEREDVTPSQVLRRVLQRAVEAGSFAPILAATTPRPAPAE